MTTNGQQPSIGPVGELLFPTFKPFAYQAQRIVCEAVWGGGDATEVARACARIEGGDFESWYAGWRWIADRARRDGEEARAAGHPETARARLLAAANYYRQAGFYLAHDDERSHACWRAQVESFAAAGELFDPPIERITWPYEGAELAGYVARPKGASGRLPAVVYLNGADGTKEESWFLGGALFVERGVAFVAIEGPGQGEPLRAHGLYTRPDYEAAVSPLVDRLLERDDVDPDRIALVGISMGGYYAGRIAAYEPRFACTALHGACFNILDDLYEYYPPVRPILQAVTGTFDDTRARERLREFDLGPHAGRISRPTYVTHGADDILVHPDAARRFFDLLEVEDKTLHVWPAEGLGGASHCSIDNPAQAYPELVDWVVDRLRADRATER